MSPQDTARRLGGLQLTLCAFVSVALSCAMPALAQITALAIEGRITDEHGAALPGTVVQLVHGANRAEVTSDTRGIFTFPTPAGSYTISAALEGYVPWTREILIIDQSLRVTIVLARVRLSESIVVTAQKREQAIADLGMSVTTVDGATLVAQGVATPADLASSEAGLTYATGPWGVPVFTLRGLGNDDNQSPQQAPAVGVYIDELSLPFSILTRGAQLDLERVEILKGPQGTLFGVSATGGAIHYIARKPTRTFDAGLRAEAGSFGRYVLDGFVNGPLTETLTGRLSIATHQGGAWQRSASRGDELGDENLTSLRGQLLWTPSPRVSARFSYFVWSDTGDPLAGQVHGPAVQNAFSSTRSALLQTPRVTTDSRAADWPPGFDFHIDQQLHSLSSHLTWRLPRGMDLTSLTHYGRFLQDDMQPGGPGPIQNADIQATGHIDVASQEIRVSKNTPQVAWVAGVQLEGTEVEQHSVSYVRTNSVTEVVTGVLDFDTYFNHGVQRSRTSGVFGHVEWRPHRTWTLTLGLRHTDDHKSFNGCTGDTGEAPGVAAFLNLALRTTVFAAGQCTSIGPDRLPGRYTGVLDEGDLSGRAGLDWRPRNGWLVYGNVSRGFKAGAFPIVAANAQRQLEPVHGEHVIAYEGGVKGRLWRDASVSGSLFHYDYSDKQIRGTALDPMFGVLAQLVNIPSSAVTGAELVVTIHPVPDLSLHASASWLDTSITEFVGYNRQGVLQNFAGAPFPLAPATEWSARVHYERRVSDRLRGFVGSDISYSDRTQGTADFVGLPEYRIDAYTLANARLGIAAADSRWRVTLWARNLTDEYYWVNAQRITDFNVRWAGRPRTAGLTFEVRWR